MAKPTTAATTTTTLNPSDYSAVTKSRGGKHYPDMISRPATKIIQRGAAAQEGWPQYFDASPCRSGHVAARMTANSQCVDCWLIAKGRPPIYATAKDRTYYKPRAERPTAAGAPLVATSTAAAPLEPDARDQKILVAVAEHGSLAAAAQALKITAASIEGRRAVNPVFAGALKALEERLGIKRVVADPTEFAWSEEIERKLCRIWIDTGDIATARDSCGVTSSQYFERIETSPDFAARVDRSAPLAAKALRERAAQLALAGNPSLLKEFIPPAEADQPKNTQTSEELVDEIIKTLSQVKSRKLQDFLATEFAAPELADPPPEPEPVTTTADSNNDDLTDLI